jgi:hypothetical protein
MASTSQIQEIKNLIERINSLDRDALVKRAKWGEIAFEVSKPDYDKVFWFSDQAAFYPLVALPESVAASFVSCLADVYSRLQHGVRPYHGLACT